MRDWMRAHEREVIVRTLIRYKNNKKMTAQHLGMGVSTLYRKLKEYGIRL